jgi:pilus assembly protein CpaF
VSEPDAVREQTIQLGPIRSRLAGLGRAYTPSDVAAAMRATGQVVSDASLLDALDELRRNSVGAGVLDPMLRLEGVTDVLVNGPGAVYLDRGRGLERAGVAFGDDDEVRRLAQRLAASVGRRLDDAVPFVDARLSDGTRFHAVLAPVSSPGTCLSLRVPGRALLSLDDLVLRGSVSPAGGGLLRRIVESRLAFLVSGGTGSGKTTLLAAMLGAVDPAERVVVVEDSRELAPRHPHLVTLEARPPNAEGAGAITLTDLVRQSLRMRPDRVVVGEVRGAELCDLLTAMNTGHEGGCGTVHANSAGDVPARLEALGALGGMTRSALHAQLASAFDLGIHVTRGRDGVRRVAQIVVFRRSADGWVQTVDAVRFEVPSDGSGQIRAVRGPGSELLDELLRR